MAKSTLFVLLMLSIFSCFRQKSPAPKDVGSALERLFPGQFQVLNSNLRVLDVMAQFKGEKRALIGDKSDPELQFLLDWKKGTDSIGFDSGTVIAAHERAKKDGTQARNLFKLLKEKGLEKFSLGVIDHAAYIQLFMEPTPAQRKQALEIIRSVLDAHAGQLPTNIFLQCMEPAGYQTQFKDIIPYGHWATGIGWQNDHQIMALDFEWEKTLKLADIMRHWELNPVSKRSTQCTALARQQAMAWAEKNLPKPCFMPSNRPIATESLEMESPAMRIGFPYFDQQLPAESSHEDPEPKGYVVGIYYFDQQAFLKLQRAAEF